MPLQTFVDSLAGFPNIIIFFANFGGGGGPSAVLKHSFGFFLRHTVARQTGCETDLLKDGHCAQFI